jgi:amidase
MIGVIGVAPTGKAVKNGTPGPHGGNMDCKEITAGATVFLPVAVDGALLAAGDLHAIMGDGEVAICAAEVAGEVTLSADVLQGCSLPTPAVETPDELLLLASAAALDECEKSVLAKAHRLLVDVLGRSSNEAARVMSLIGDLGVSQVVDPLKTMTFALPKSALSALDTNGRLAGILS